MKLQTHTTTLLTVLSCAILCHAQAEQDPFVPNKVTDTNAGSAKAGKPSAGDPVVLAARFEMFSMPMQDAAAMQRKRMSDSDCYKAILEKLESGSVKQEIFILSRMQSGEKCTNESIIEEIYPTEITPPTMPQNFILQSCDDDQAGKNSISEDSGTNQVSRQDLKIDGIFTAATPAAFETRNTGETLDMEAYLPDDSRFCQVRIFPEQDLLVDYSRSGKGPCEILMPTFEVRRLSVSTVVPLDKPSLIGSMNRPSHSIIDSDASDRVSFAFITMSIQH